VVSSKDAGRRSALHAAILMFLSGLCFTVLGAIVKHIADSVPLPMIVLARMGIALLIAIAWLAPSGLAEFKTSRPAAHFWRSIAGTLSLVAYVYALAHLPLADAIALSFTTPIWAIPIAALLIGEAANRRRWIATLVGLIGMIILLRPSAQLHHASFVALASAILSATSISLVRGLTRSEPPDRIIFYFSLVGTLASIGPALLWWRTPSLAEAAWLVAIGVLAAIGLALSARALAVGEVTFLTPTDFLRLPLAALVGFVLFAEIPDLWVFIGSAIIAGSSVALVHAETSRSLPARAASLAHDAADK
jgi:drug/metabolite transporter (DMT)-like permease